MRKACKGQRAPEAAALLAGVDADYVDLTDRRAAGAPVRVHLGPVKSG
jgi:hypothetical protein